MQVTVESCTQIRINELQKRVRKLIRRDYPDSSEEELYKYTLTELNRFTTNGQTFEYQAQRNHLGGHRWFFVCPRCKKRVNMLIMPPSEVKSKEHLFLCKNCHSIKNQSVVMGQNPMYLKVTRPLKRMKEIEDKIAVGHLSMDKVKGLLDEYDTLEASMKDTDEYRLYMFKKRHNMIP